VAALRFVNVFTSGIAAGGLLTVLTPYALTLRDLDPLADVIQQACPALVPLVEGGKADSPEAEAAVRGYVQPLLTEGGVVQPVVDTLLLGCTHYPLLRSVIERVAGPGVRVVDSAATTALAVREVLLSHRLIRDGGAGTNRVFATGPTDRFRAVARTIFGEDLPAIEQASLG
jgi:glutamate racemase